MHRTTTVVLGVVGGLLAVFLVMRENHLAAKSTKEEGEPGKEKDSRIIHTSGSATVRVLPNRARLFLAVETSAPNVKDARAANKKDMENIIVAIVSLKVPDLMMKSTNVKMDVEYSKEEKQTVLPRIVGYRVVTTFTVLVANDDPDKLAATAAKVLDAALEKGANSLQQIDFFRDDLTDARRQALTKATEDAVANANALALGAKRNVADIISIDGNPEWFNPVWNLSISNVPPSAETSKELVAGQVEVTCRVSIQATYGAGK